MKDKPPKMIITPEAIAKTLDAMEVAHHDPNALTIIDDRSRELLLLIKQRIKERPILTYEQILELPEHPGHEEFLETSDQDLAAITSTLDEQQLPKKFYSPIRGRYKFLEHILICPLCLALVNPENDFQIKKEGAFYPELKKRGYKKKKSESGATFREDIDFPKEH
jgi:hypothetical protein